MKVTVKNHTPFTDTSMAHTSRAAVKVELQEGSVVSDIFAVLDIEETEGLILVNGKLAKSESILKDGDFVSLVPEIFGG